MVKQVLGKALQEANGLVEVDRHCHFAQFLAYRILHNPPNIDLLVRIPQKRQGFAVWNRQVRGD
jgi:hypothetical protein